ncbi:MAG: restriction endonuclease subunit S [Alteromonas sp.]|nr:restriction endonuclease subunit S [Alteromonas sp.]
MSEVNLPSEWIATELENIGDVVTGKTPSKNKPEYFGGDIPFIKPADVNDQGEITLTDEQITVLGAETVPLIPPGSIVVTCIGNLGRCGITTARSATNQQINSVLPSNKVDVKFLYYQLRTLKEWMLSESSATTVTIINKSKFSKAPIICPPIAEQKVIADKLDALLAQVEITKARLERIPEILKTFRQSVLAAAVSGKLTQEWREKPAEWIEMKLNDVADNVVDCPHSTPKWSALGKYCVKTTAFNPFYLDLSEQGFVSEEVFAERIKRLKPEPGDILYSREGTVGIACQIPSDTELCLGQRMVLIRAGSEINSKFLTIVLNSDKILSIVRQMTIGSTVPRVNMKDIRSYPIPVPTQNEQTEIIRRVEELFAFADRIEQRANVALDRVNNLTQSILAKAFRGELTTDWRAANPELISGENSAEALLAKIKAEREALKPAKKSSVRKKS